VAGTAITASLMFSTVTFPYLPWHTALIPVLAVAVLAFVFHPAGQGQERSGSARPSSRRGRSASQVAANLGVAAIASQCFYPVVAPRLPLVRAARPYHQC
jgi:hypothetical protein